ncbi:hypothetical protein Mgrana_00683 [Meiothermus granaticius NBRC 107808]|uniref:Uncharacterized protein n=1 Tax=Meiothermus granaticius NBRC 107808 TaxID=1227551 RepID=A0A399F9T5_9DEIN|nr:hypothetical protein Mgrana_00683 [Meiothermus granaticius NBRC 107808]
MNPMPFSSTSLLALLNGWLQALRERLVFGTALLEWS